MPVATLPRNLEMRAKTLFPSLTRPKTPADNTHRQRGFSLVEIIVVLGIILMILGFTAPAVVGILRGRKVEQALTTISDVLERTRIEAVTQNTYLWAALANVPLVESGTGQDELWILSFRGKKGESRIDASSTILPAGPLRRIEGITLVTKDNLPEGLAALALPGSKDFINETVSSKTLKWAGSGASSSSSGDSGAGGAASARNFDRLILFTPRGEALVETGDTDLPLPQAYLWLGLSKTRNGQVAPKEKDNAALSISGLTGRVTVVRQ
jgi:prepilin-type N-terminal cleavage/methylation domain-containing protein